MLGFPAKYQPWDSGLTEWQNQVFNTGVYCVADPSLDPGTMTKARKNSGCRLL